MIGWFKAFADARKIRNAADALECPECKHRFKRHHNNTAYCCTGSYIHESDMGHGIIRKTYLPCRCKLYRSELDEYARRKRLLDPRCQSLIAKRGECAKMPHGLPYAEAIKHKPGCDFHGCTEANAGWCRRNSDGSVSHRCWKGHTSDVCTA